MATLGMFGRMAPRIRRIAQAPVDPLMYAPEVAPPSEPGQARRPSLTAESFLKQPAPAAPDEPGGKTPPMGMFGSSAPKGSGYTPGKRDWWKEISSDPLGFFLTGSNGLSAQREEAMAYEAAQSAAEERARREAALAEQAQSAGIDPGGVLAMQLNPEKFGESYSTNYEAANVSGGDSRLVKGRLITAPKVGVDEGYGYTQTPDGIEWGEQRGQSYGEATNAGTLAETTRNNSMTNARGWAGIRNDRDRLAFDRTKAQNENGGLGKLTPMQQAVDKNWADDLVSWATTGSADFANNMALLNGAIGKIDEGKEISGPGSNFLGGWGRDVWGQEGWAVQKDIEQVVQRNLKAVLGAQFTQSEGDRLIQRAYDPTAEESVNRRRLQMLKQQMEIAARQKTEASEYYNRNGTMVGYRGHIPTAADFEAALGDQQSSAQATEAQKAQQMLDNWDSLPAPYKVPAYRTALEAAARGGGATPQAVGQPADPEDDEAFINNIFGPDEDGPPPGVSPEEWDVMDEEDRAAFR